MQHGADAAAVEDGGQVNHAASESHGDNTLVAACCRQRIAHVANESDLSRVQRNLHAIVAFGLNRASRQLLPLRQGQPLSRRHRRRLSWTDGKSCDINDAGGALLTLSLLSCIASPIRK